MNGDKLKETLGTNRQYMHDTSATTSTSPYAIILPMDTASIPQLDPEAYPDPRPTPELCLLAAVVQMALRDLQKCRHQEEAREFIESQGLELFCDWLEWDAEAIRCAAAEGTAPRYKQWA